MSIIVGIGNLVDNATVAFSSVQSLAGHLKPVILSLMHAPTSLRRTAIEVYLLYVV